MQNKMLTFHHWKRYRSSNTFDWMAIRSTDIAPISKLRNLEKIGLDANRISDFRPLASLPYITDLNTSCWIYNFNPVDLDKCPTEEGTAARLVKYCKRMIKNEVNIQDAIDPKQ